MKRPRFRAAVAAAMLLTLLSTTTVLAGEITGNGTYKGVNGHSSCAFSGQEDLQWFEDDGQQVPKEEPTRGDPAHAQSWGQAKPAWDFLISIGLHPGHACNPTRAVGEH